MAHIAGLIAGGAHPSPVGHAPVITTTTHKTLRGPRGAMILTDAAHASAIDKAVFPGLQGGPHNHTTAGIAVALREAAQPSFRGYAAQSWPTPTALANALQARGFDLVSGGTDNHLLLVDLTSKGIGGKPAAKALDRAGIELNFNTVPFDQRRPFDPSGIRLGTPGDHHPRPDRAAHAAARGLDRRGDHRRRPRTTRQPWTASPPKSATCSPPSPCPAGPPNRRPRPPAPAPRPRGRARATARPPTASPAPVASASRDLSLPFPGPPGGHPRAGFRAHRRADARPVLVPGAAGRGSRRGRARMNIRKFPELRHIVPIRNIF